MGKKLTAAAVEKLKPDTGKRLEKPDGVVDGLFLLIQSSGAKGWAFRYRFPVGGKIMTHKITIGSYPALSLADAREEAGKPEIAPRPGSEPSIPSAWSPWRSRCATPSAIPVAGS